MNSSILINGGFDISYFDRCSLSLDLLAALISSIQRMTPNYWTPHLNLLLLFGALSLLNWINFRLLFRYDCLNFKLRDIWLFFLWNWNCLSEKWLLLSLDRLRRRLFACLPWRSNLFLFNRSNILNAIRRWARI